MAAVIQRKRYRRALTRTGKAESTYVQGLRKIFEHIHQTYQNFMFPRLASIAKQDALHETELELILGTLQVSIRSQVQKEFNEMAGELTDEEQVKFISELLGVDANSLGITHILDHFRDENVRLVENAGRDYADQVREIFTRPDAHLMRVEELKALLLERADVSQSRAELIARDQVLKLNGQINQTRQTKAGVTKYIWSTSKDSRVRPEHAALDGQVFDWQNAPAPGHPGEDFQCRCVALPIIEELEGV